MDAQMTDWNYQREEREESAKVTGRLRCVITDVEETESKTSGLPMIVVSVRPSGTRFAVKSYIVKNERFNRNMTQFFDAFPEIGDGNFSFLEWIGAMGAAMFDTDDRGYLRVKYWIDAARAELLPEFEGEKPEKQTVTSLEDDPSEDGLPF